MALIRNTNHVETFTLSAGGTGYHTLRAGPAPNEPSRLPVGSLHPMPRLPTQISLSAVRYQWFFGYRVSAEAVQVGPKFDVAIVPWSALLARESRHNIPISVALRNDAEQITV
jgi:hypothetical protein